MSDFDERERDRRRDLNRDLNRADTLKGGPSAKLIIGLIALVLAAVFILQNTGKSRVHFLWLNTEWPLALLLLVALLLGCIVGWTANWLAGRNNR